MSVKPENQFISGVHRYIPKGKPHYEKMCNPFSSGTADVWYSGNRSDMWIEYKYLPRKPQRGIIVPALSPLQQQWLNGRYDEGRSIYVVVGCPDGGVIMRDREWDHGLPVEEYLARLKDRRGLADWIVHETMR